FGDRVQTLITAVGRTLVVVDLTVQEDDPCLAGRSLRAAVTDYRFLPVAVNGQEPAAANGQRLKPGDRVTAVAELPDLERLLPREPVPTDWRVVIDACPPTARDSLIPLIRVTRQGDQAGAGRRP